MRKPSKYHLAEVFAWVADCKSVIKSRDNMRWTHKRPVSHEPWYSRFVIAWRVFIGRYDAIEWWDGQ